MSETERRCGNCRWFEPSEFYDPDDEDAVASCGWPAERLPHSLRYGNRERVWVTQGEGTDCSCFEEKGGHVGTDT